MYTNDLILTCNNNEHLTQLVHHLATEYSLNEIQPLHFFLGVKFIPKIDGLFLTQQSYVRDLLNRTHIDGVKIVTTPLSTTTKLTLADGSPSVDATKFQCVIGAL